MLILEFKLQKRQKKNGKKYNTIKGVVEVVNWIIIL